MHVTNLSLIIHYWPLAAAAFFKSLQAIIIRAPRLAKSIAVSLPIPAFAPVMITVLPVSLFLLVQTPLTHKRYAFIAPMTQMNPIPSWDNNENPKMECNILFAWYYLYLFIFAEMCQLYTTVECRLVLNLRFRKLIETPECRIPQLLACKTDLEFSPSHAISTEPFFFMCRVTVMFSNLIL